MYCYQNQDDQSEDQDYDESYWYCIDYGYYGSYMMMLGYMDMYLDDRYQMDQLFSTYYYFYYSILIYFFIVIVIGIYSLMFMFNIAYILLNFLIIILVIFYVMDGFYLNIV